MKAVSRFEADLLHLLHAVLGRAPRDEALKIVLQERDRPPCLSRVAVELIQDTLARGCVWRLAREGVWRRARYLRGDRIASGRLWERTPPEELGLRFSGQTLDFLIRLTAYLPGDRPPRSAPYDAEPTVGDSLLHFFAYEALRETPAADPLAEVARPREQRPAPAGLPGRLRRASRRRVAPPGPMDRRARGLSVRSAPAPPHRALGGHRARQGGDHRPVADGRAGPGAGDCP